MSLSNPIQSSNPATKFIQFSGKRGEWYYYDKEKEKNINLPLPMYFIVLDELHTITGFNERNNCGIYSNEIHNFNEMLTVKTFTGNIKVYGIYQDIQYEVKSHGGRYCKSIYAMRFDDKGLRELINIKFYGSSLGPYIDLKTRVGGSILALMPNMSKGKKGDNEFYIPTIDKFKIKEDLLQEAMEMDKQLQEYLRQYKENKSTKETVQEESLDYHEPIVEVPVDEYNEPEPKQEEDDLPF